MNTSMNANKPLKRSPHLKAISRDHHHGLLVCWKIREGFKRNIAIERIKRYTDWFWKTQLADHFEVEEIYIFPVLGNDHELVKRALTEHRRLKRLFEQETEAWRTLNLIEEELDSHIRFEERILFNEVQRVATEPQLAAIAKHHRHPTQCENWDDLFWE
ncbi:hypothetical protein GCM10011386_15170 [Parapedobacter defluvii]|uniref:Hemerythrin HHE cation binding domain-containing protein n=1 Tax=Parapedobacter defluvii TaxID=2045106 RepID=A0ABQ1LJG7_9SPHI|nr:hemerythrin domain-containing protein [Parapedobacter defluvii]GGC24196.1 hypothetical protein GCM10011386_15170 [Parapedobacter defluvii]